MGAEMSDLAGLGPGDEGQAYTEGRQDWLSTFHLRLPQPDGPVKEALAGDVDAIRATSHETGNITWMPDGSALVAAGIVVPGDAYTRGGMDAWTGVVEIYRRDNATRALHRQL